MAGKISEMTAASAAALNNELEVNAAGATRKVTPQQILDAITALADAGALADANKTVVTQSAVAKDVALSTLRTYLQTGITVPTAASAAEQEAGTEANKYAAPATQHRHPSAAKFWVKWTANSTTILASYNMTSIADTAVGDADGTIGTDFSGADWCALVSTQDTVDGWDAEQCQGSGFNAQAAGTFGVLCSTITDGGTSVTSLTDPEQWHVSGFGDHA